MPSLGRTVYLPPVMLRSASHLAWPAKDPNAILDHTLDCTPFLLDAGGDSIITNTPQAASSPTDLDISLLACTGTAITWLIGGGAPGGPAGGACSTDYAVRIYFQTQAGLTVTCTIYLPIRTISTPAYFPAV